jgi:hypothetical protein
VARSARLEVDATSEQHLHTGSIPSACGNGLFSGTVISRCRVHPSQCNCRCRCINASGSRRRHCPGAVCIFCSRERNRGRRCLSQQGPLLPSVTSDSVVCVVVWAIMVDRSAGENSAGSRSSWSMSSGAEGQRPRSAITRFRAFRHRLPTGGAHGFPSSGRCQ